MDTIDKIFIISILGCAVIAGGISIGYSVYCVCWLKEKDK